MTEPRLRERPDFVRFWTAFTVSSFGVYVTTLAIQVIVVRALHRGASEVGLINAARWLPYVLFGVLAGVLVDRARRRPIVAAADLLRGLLLLAIPVLSLAGLLGVTSLAVVMLAFGVLSVANDAASQAIVPRLVPHRLITKAHSRLDGSDAVAQTSGPALAGGLVALLTAPWAVVVDAASYFVSAWLLLRMRVDEPRGARLSLRGVRTEALEGLRWVYTHRTLRWYAVGTHSWFVCWAVVGAVLPVYALRTLQLGPAGFGLLTAFAGLGAVGGSLVAPRLGLRFGPGRVVVTGYGLAGVATLLVVAARPDVGGWTLYAAGQLLTGFALGAQNSNELGYRQSVTPDRLQARMGSNLRSINRAMIVIGAPSGGLLADSIGLRPVLFAAAVGFVVVGLMSATTPFWRASYSDPH